MIPACFDTNPSQDNPIITKLNLSQLPIVPGLFIADNVAKPSPAGANAVFALYPLPVGALLSPGIDGDARGLRVTMFGFSANNANAKTIFAQLNTVTVFTQALTINVIDNWRAWFEVWFAPGPGAIVHRFSGMSIHGQAPGGVSGSGIIGSSNAGITLDTSGILTLKTAVTQTAASDATQESVTIEVF